VNNSNSTSTRTLSHDEIKATIHLQHNSSSNNNNNRVSRSLSKDCPDVAHSSKKSFSTRPEPESSVDYKEDTEVHRRQTNSLLRRFSRKSRSRSGRRKSLPVDNVLSVNSVNSKQSENLSCQIANPPKHGPSENCSSKIENVVMSSFRSSQDDDVKKKPDEKPRKSNSIRKRLMSFTRKRSSSQERKTILKENIFQPTDSQNGQMNKALSYSSPQLSIFAVNSNSKQTSNKLVF